MKDFNQRLVRAEMLDAQELINSASILTTRIITAICTDDIDAPGLLKHHGALVTRVEQVLGKLCRIPITGAPVRRAMESKALYVRVSAHDGPGEIFVEIETADGESVRLPSVPAGSGRLIGPFYLSRATREAAAGTTGS